MSKDCATSFLSLDITDSAIIEQIDLIKEERNLSEGEIKRPRANTKENKTEGRLGVFLQLFQGFEIEIYFFNDKCISTTYCNNCFES